MAAICRPAMTPSIRHEINNVLAALMAEVQLLQMDRLTPEQAGGLDRILTQVRRLRDLLGTVTLTAPEPPAE
jgi:signal transduction histidine kinase